ncbi:MAG: RNase adapter RapZ [Candidatus Magnetobacterium sp. LHC-1]|uniref:RNase adapter RapZ n=1 Tax=Candidatus Magnetobacterium casense TaxID=1455061 RepID=A0ABS6RX55_9BACT|nr:RNase adapter RapZ [Candidatus Magnetobacterium casensis]MBF0606024.1 RNase adapter RapZ [Nitrospirota bacterium]MBV6340930.1 RNase adapter RapZ [Candidatus Magnetobacterium casensis]
MNPKPCVIIVSGLSGAGKTVMLRTLEDNDYFCVDNLPSSLIDEFLTISTANEETTKIAIGIDIREKDFLRGIDGIILKLRQMFNLSVVFLEAETDILIRRYKETRRPHPLMQLAHGDINKAIELEATLLKSLRDAADVITDTSYYSPHQLRHFIAANFGGLVSNVMRLTVLSFGFKYGIPQHVDMLLDVRFLPNPHFVDDLRPLTGKDEPVRSFVLNSQDTVEYLEKMKDLFNFLLPRYIKEGKTTLTIAVGCTGGRHRAPTIAEQFVEFVKHHNLTVELIHRDI